MGTTPNYALPYPEDSSSVDVPRDFEALARAVDLLTFDRFPRYAIAETDTPYNGTSLQDTVLRVDAAPNTTYAVDAAIGYAANTDVDAVIGTRFASGTLDIGTIAMSYTPVTRDGPASAPWVRGVTPAAQGLVWVGGVGLTGQIGLTCRLGGTLRTGSTGGQFVIVIGQLYNHPTAPAYVLGGSYLGLTRIRTP